MEENTQAENRVYELGFHIVPTIPQEKVGEKVEEIKAAIAKYDAEFIADKFPEMISLAYEIEADVDGVREGYERAYFGWVKFALPTESLESLKTDIEALGGILRFIVVKTVREDTMHVELYSKEKREEEGDEEKAAEAPASDVEIDKSIDEMVTEE